VRTFTPKPIPRDEWPKVREAIEILDRTVVTDWNKGRFKALRLPWNDEELEDFLGDVLS